MSNPKKIVATINLVYFALPVVMVGFALFVFFWIYTAKDMAPVDAGLESILRIIVIASVPVGMGISYLVFNSVLKSITPDMPLQTKLHVYQRAVLIRAAGFEMPGMFAAVVALITSQHSFLLFTAVMVVLFSLFRPTVSAITADLHLTAAEKNALGHNASF